MHQTLAGSERVVKKVSRGWPLCHSCAIPDSNASPSTLACNTCRLKRKKCDGLDPCAFCVDNKLECLYSKEPRRRGPPSGYLRYTETRVAILEILIGLYLSNLPKKEDDEDDFDPFLEAAKTLQSEAKVCTQDVWDAHKAIWARCASSKLVDELVVSFAPFTPRSSQDTPVKTLLPPPHSTNIPAAHHHNQVSSTSEFPSNREGGGQKSSENHRTANQAAPFNHTLRPESFERASTHERLTERGSSITTFTPGETRPTPEQQDWEDNEVGPVGDTQPYMNMHDYRQETPGYAPSTYTRQPPQSYGHNVISLPGSGSNQLRSTPDLELALGLNGPQEYTGSYWRTVDLSAPEAEPYIPSQTTPLTLVPPSTTTEINIPPSHTLSRLLDIYYQHSHPSYPLLPSRATFDATLVTPSCKSGPLSALILSICAYSGRLSPSTQSSTNLSAADNGGLAGKIAADLWYEQARTALSTLLSKGSSLELVQATLLLSLRDYGKGNESQAWLLVGLAIRMAQDMHLHEDTNDGSAQSQSEESKLRRNIWGVCTILDLLLSLQMGRPQACSEALKRQLASSTRSCASDVDLNASAPFSYSVSLCRVISMINFNFYLGYSSTTAQTPSELLMQLRSELDLWHHRLPVQYRISIGHQPRRDVLEINMLYHVAIILLYRPICREQPDSQATEIFLEAASSFNVLLETYRQTQTVGSPNLSGNTFDLSHTSPHMIYLIYTVAIAHLSGYKLRQHAQNNGNTLTAMSSTSALQTQLHLLKCLEALASIGFTWELARRCWKALDTFMEMENLKPKGEVTQPENTSLILGKRKREMEEMQKRTWSMAARTNNPALGSDNSGSPQCASRSVNRVSMPCLVPDLGTPVTSTSPDMPNVNQFSPSFNHLSQQQQSQQQQQQQQQGAPVDLAASGWNGSSSSVPYITSSSSENGLGTFDLSMFPTKWIPEASQAVTSEWDNTWDDSPWSQSYMGGMGMF